MEIDQKKAKEMIGKVVLVGVTYQNVEGEETGLDQFFGKVLRINADDGLVICRGDNGEEMSLPPMLEYYNPASPGIYSLKASSHKVTDPDYLATWVVHQKGA